MRYQCLNKDCGKVFIHPAKLINQTQTTTKVENDYLGTSASFTGIPTTTTHEYHVCPYCNNVNIDEYVEPQPQIVSVKSVPIEEVDSLIKEGYVVLEGGIYAKTCNLIKKEEKKPSLRERNVVNDKDAATLREELASFTKEK